MKLLILFLILPLINVQSIEISCRFEWFHSNPLEGYYYRCFATCPSIKSSNTIVTLSANNDEPDPTETVQAIKIEHQDHVEYFPHGIDKIFPNLIEVDFWHSGLKELHQEDLKPFDKLKSILVHDNELTYIEKDLFKFNTKLVYINLDRNKISFIHPTVFDDLSSLKWLFLIEISCMNERSWDDRHITLRVIEIAKHQCSIASTTTTTTERSTTSSASMTHSSTSEIYDLTLSDADKTRENSHETSMSRRVLIYVIMPLSFLLIIVGAILITMRVRRKRGEEMRCSLNPKYDPQFDDVDMSRA